MKVLSGIQPTGRPHWGNYFGAIQQYIALQGNEQSFYFIADLHALTTVREADVLRQSIQDSALDLLALGLEPDKATLFRQSDVPEVTELTWLLMTITQMHLLEKCHAYKDKKAKGLAADAGLFTYPVLMAADILMYDSEVVPVGQDQVQHVEVTRDLAQRFNSLYGADCLVLPNAHVLDSSAKVPGLDGEKMSKSYNNTIPVFETPRKLKKIINKIVTDSKALEDAKNPDTCAVFDLYRLFADENQRQVLADKYRAGGMGYGEAKTALYDAAMESFGPAFEKRIELENRSDEVEDILQAGAKRARSKAREVIERVRSACGLVGKPAEL
jgi:tryptophanyl-tRNA synthetase